jgi:regulatory protein
MDNNLAFIRQKAMIFLGQREHSLLELRRKLARYSFESSLIEQVLTQLQAENLLSEERFIESFVRARMMKGYGPLRIQQELRQRGIEHLLDVADNVWVEQACRVRQKRFGCTLPRDPHQRAKQMRFLRYRGFSHSQIKKVLSSVPKQNKTGV